MTTHIENAKTPGSFGTLVTATMIGGFAPLIGAGLGWFFCLAASILSVLKSLIALKPSFAALVDPFSFTALYAMSAFAAGAALIVTILFSFSTGLNARTNSPRWARILAGTICGALSGLWLVLTHPLNAPHVHWGAGEISLAILILAGVGSAIAALGSIIPPGEANKK